MTAPSNSPDTANSQAEAPKVGTRFADLPLALRMRVTLKLSEVCQLPDTAVRGIDDLLVTGKMSSRQVQSLLTRLTRNKPEQKISDEMFTCHLRMAAGLEPEPRLFTAGDAQCCVDMQLHLEHSIGGVGR